MYFLAYFPIQYLREKHLSNTRCSTIKKQMPVSEKFKMTMLVDNCKIRATRFAFVPEKKEALACSWIQLSFQDQN